MESKKRAFYFLLTILSLSAIPFVLYAQGVVPCGQGSDPANACTLCHLIVGIYNIITWGRNILITVAAVGIFISGVMYIVSSGSEKAMSQAKSFLTSSLVGFTLVLGAWFIVNVVMWILSANMESIGKENWYTFTCVTKSTAPEAVGPAYYPEDTAITNNPYTYDSAAIEAQKADASDELNSLLNCMQPKLSDGAKRISSISDSAGMDKCAYDWSRPPCAHAKNSCHYGGTRCKGKSYAVDFGNERQSSLIISAAKECGGKALMEGDHVHVSVGSCGCDE